MFITNSGNAVPVSNTLEILGSGGITTAASGNIITISGGGSVAETFDADSGSATPSANTIKISGGITGLTTTASSSTLSLTGTLSSGNGGTGVNNGSSTLTLGGSLTTSGAFGSTFTMTGITTVTFPTTGTLLSSTSSGYVASVTGTANQVIASAATGAITLSLPQSIATTSVVQFAEITAQNSSTPCLWGISNNNATSPLTNANQNNLVLWNDNSTSNNWMQIAFLDAAENTVTMIGTQVTNQGTGVADLVFYTNSGSGIAQQARLTGSGVFELTNPLLPAYGGTGTATAFTTGSVVFAGSSGVYTQNNLNFFWDNVNHRLGIGTASPGTFIEIADGTNPKIYLTGAGLSTSDPAFISVFTSTFQIGTFGSNVFQLLTDNTVALTISTSQVVTLANALPVGSGGTGTSTTFTAGSIVFAGTSGIYNQDNSKLFWDNTNFRLSISNNSSANLGDSLLTLNGNTTAAPAITGGLAVYEHIIGAAGVGPVILIDAFAGSGSYASRVSGGTAASPTALGNNVAMTTFETVGYDGSSYAAGGYFQFFTAGAWTSSNHGCSFFLNTTPVGATSPLTSFSIANGNITLQDSNARQMLINNAVSTSATTTVGGFTLPPLAAGYIQVTLNGTQVKIPYFGN